MGSTGTIIYYVVIFAIFGGIIFFMNRSQKKKQKKEQEQRDSVQIGDEIVTIGGFVVRVVSFKEDHFFVESPADHSKMKVMKWALSAVNTVHDTEAK